MPQADTDECIALLESHLKLNPATRELNYKLGSLYGNKGRYARAAEHFKKELTLDPSPRRSLTCNLEKLTRPWEISKGRWSATGNWQK